MSDSTPVALVTGASGGIGAAVVEALGRGGRTVVATDIGGESLERCREDLDARGLDVHTIAADLTRPEDIRRLVGFIEADFGVLDVLVNNAGVTRPARAERMTDDKWDDVLEVNLSASFRLCRAVAELLRTRPPCPEVHRKIVNVASTNGIYGQVHNVNYSSAKAGLIGLTRALSREWAPARINVNAVAPGFIAGTGMTREADDRRSGLPAEVLETLTAEIPLGRAGRPEDVAGAVRFLASEESDFITGQVLEVHGGKEFMSVVGQ